MNQQELTRMIGHDDANALALAADVGPDEGPDPVDDLSADDLAKSSRYRSLLEKLPFLRPEHARAAGLDSKEKIYVFGNLGYSFRDETRRDAFKQAYRGWRRKKHDDAGDLDERLQEFLEDQPWQRAALTWTLSVDQAPFYAVQPGGNHAKQAYELLHRYYFDAFWERKCVSMAGWVIGKTRLATGDVLPVIQPAIAGMEVWSKRTLKSISDAEKMKALLDVVYDQIRNLGVEARDRAVNFAVTDAFRLITPVAGKLDSSGYGLNSIYVSPSPVSRRGSECYDVKIQCFKFDNTMEQRFFRLTIDVSDVVPARVGEVQSWKGSGY